MEGLGEIGTVGEKARANSEKPFLCLICEDCVWLPYVLCCYSSTWLSPCSSRVSVSRELEQRKAKAHLEQTEPSSKHHL